MKIMSVDYGDVRTGIAFCDKNEMLASAYTVIYEDYAPKLIKKICDIISEQSPELVVVGLPRNMDGSYGFRVDKCREFAADLEKACGVKVELEDERLTTVIANDILNKNNVGGKKKKKCVDAVSATVILQSFIDKRKSGSNKISDSE